MGDTNQPANTVDTDEGMAADEIRAWSQHHSVPGVSNLTFLAHLHLSASGTPARAVSICCPHPFLPDSERWMVNVSSCLEVGQWGREHSLCGLVARLTLQALTHGDGGLT